MRHEDRHACGYDARVDVVYRHNMRHLFQVGTHFIEIKTVGVSSRSTRTALRNSLMARGIIMSAMMPPATASNPAQPVQMSTLADTITATDLKRHS